MKLPDPEAQTRMREQDPGFQAVGSVELKKAKTGLAGILSWRKKPSNEENGALADHGELPPGAPDAAPPGATPGEEGFVDGFQSSVWDQIDDLSDPGAADRASGVELSNMEATHSSGAALGQAGVDQPLNDSVAAHHVASKHDAAVQSVADQITPNDRAYSSSDSIPIDRNTILVGAPPLLVFSMVPAVIHAVPKEKKGLAGTLSYGLKAPKVAQRQRDRIRVLSSQLSKLKKKEQEVVVALGRAARVHNLAPSDDVGGGVDEQPSDQAGDQSGEQLSAEENRLLELGQQIQNMAGHIEIAERTLDQGEQQLAQLRQREQELRTPPQPGLSEAEATQRVKEYEEVKAARAKAEQDLDRIQEKVAASKAPMQRLKDEIDQLRGSIQNSNQRKMQSRAKAAKEASAKPGGGPSNQDAVLGQSLLQDSNAPAMLRQLVVSVDTNRRRVRRWEEALSKQQAELSEFDESRARIGFWMLMGAILGGLVFILGSGEIVRRVLLSM